MSSEWDDEKEKEHEAHAEMLAQLSKKLHDAREKERHGTLLDITEPEYVQIEIDWEGKVVWIHVDGISRLRACRIKHPVEIVDHRPERHKP